jgi:hypothetical protein
MAMTQVVSENDGPEAAARSVTTTWSLLIPAGGERERRSRSGCAVGHNHLVAFDSSDFDAGPSDYPHDLGCSLRTRQGARPIARLTVGYEVALLGYDRAIRHRKSCLRGPQGLQIDRGEIAESFLPSEIVRS